MLNGEKSIDRPLGWGMVGGGRTGQVGYKHRTGALRDNTAHRMAYGYMPLDAGRVGAALDARDLGIVAGTTFDDLVSPANRETLVRQTDEICALIVALPRPQMQPGQRYDAPYLTVMDRGHDERDYAAGHSDRAPRLDDVDWTGMIGNIRAVAERAGRYGVTPVIHPHAGGYITLEQERDPRDTGSILVDLAASRALLRETGF